MLKKLLVRIGKRGSFSMMEIAGIILALISLFALLSFLVPFVTEGLKITESKSCEVSVGLRANTALRLAYNYRVVFERTAYHNVYLTPLLCSTRPALLKKSVYKNKKPEEFIEGVMALMRECWLQFNEGKHDIIFESPDSYDTCFKCFDVKVEWIPTDEKGISKYPVSTDCEIGERCIKKQTFLNFVEKEEFQKEVLITPKDGVTKIDRIPTSYKKYFANTKLHFDTEISYPGLYAIYYSDPTYIKAIKDSKLDASAKDAFAKNGLYFVHHDSVLTEIRKKGENSAKYRCEIYSP